MKLSLVHSSLLLTLLAWHYVPLPGPQTHPGLGDPGLGQSDVIQQTLQNYLYGGAGEEHIEHRKIR